MSCFKLSMNRLLKRIDQANGDEIDEIIRKLILWQKKRVPEYEMVVMSLPRYDLEERSRQIDLMAEALKKYVDPDGGSGTDHEPVCHLVRNNSG